MVRRWRVGTRGSRLARIQTDLVIDQLRLAFPHDEFEPVIVRTTGDQDLQRPLSAFGVFGVFVKELERALLDGTIDLAVHSAKDLTTMQPDGLVVSAYTPRGPVHDVLITRHRWDLDSDGLPQLPQGARVATSSVRRQGQLQEWRPDLQLENLRGSVETRLRKLHEQDLDGIMLAAAGLERLGLVDGGSLPVAAGDPVPVGGGYAYYLDPERFVPAAGQGVLAVQVNLSQDEARQRAESIDDAGTRATQLAERAFMLGMGASCAVPIGAWARVEGNQLRLLGYYRDADPPRQEISGPVDDAQELGAQLARQMQRAARPHP